MAAPEIQTRSDILWSGENPIILLKPSADAQETTAAGSFASITRRPAAATPCS